MRGVKSEDLVAIIDFIYCGEVNIFQENLDIFMATAEELKIKGLAGEAISDNEKEKFLNNSIAGKKKTKLPPKHIETVSIDNYFKTEVLEEESNVETPAKPRNITIFACSDIQELKAKVKSMMTKGENIVHGQKADICTICGKEGTASNIMDHIEANHLEGVSLPCTSCDKKFRSRNGLRKHKCIGL